MGIFNNGRVAIAALCALPCGLVAGSSPLAGATTATTTKVPTAFRGHLLFTRTQGNDVQTIFLAGRTGERRLSTPGAYCCVLRISPNHQMILVLPGGNIPPPVTGGTINFAGHAFTRLHLVDKKLNLVPEAWSPDGKRIAFEGWDDSAPSRTGVYTANTADGTGLLRITTRPGLHHDAALDYSPDGKRLIIYRAAGIDPDPHVGGSLFVVGVDGSGLHRITGNSARPADWARWSPNGDRIIFATQRTAPTGAIWTVRPDGSHLQKIFSGSGSRFPIQPIWAPDETQILFALDPNNDQFTHPANALYLARPDGTHLQMLIGGANFKSQPEWWH